MGGLACAGLGCKEIAEPIHCNDRTMKEDGIVIEGVPVEDMVNHSFYEVFKNGDRKWIVAYADVALNGGQSTLHDYSPEIIFFLPGKLHQRLLLQLLRKSNTEM